MSVPYLLYETHRSYVETLNLMKPIPVSRTSLIRLEGLKSVIIQDMFETLDYNEETLRVLMEIRYYINEIKREEKL